MNHASRHCGYVLVMTLMLIALACLVLAGFARHSLLLALESHDAAADLQRRWGARSCELALLDRADQILEYLDAQRGRDVRGRQPVASFQSRIELGDMTFELLLADEDAKLNVNSLYSCWSEQDVATLVRELSRGGAGGFLHVLLRPSSLRLTDGLAPSSNPSRQQVRATAATSRLSESDSELSLPSLRLRGEESRVRGPDFGQSGPAVFGSWGQVFSLDRVPAEVPVPVALSAATRDLTCWGDGKLNLRRASDTAVQSLGRLSAGTNAARRLVELRRQDPNRKLSDTLNRLQLAHDERAQLERLLTDQSSCYSLWLTVSRGGQRWYELCIAVGRPVTENRSGKQAAESEQFVQLSHFVW